MSNNIKQAFKVTIILCLVCSFLVSTAAVLLNSIYRENQRLDKINNILQVSGLDIQDKDSEAIFRQFISVRLIELKSGRFLSDDEFNDELNIEHFDSQLLANHPVYGKTISPDADIAKLKIRPRFMPVYFVSNGEQVQQLVLPVYGKGLWSTVYGFLALASDLTTIKGISFYQHGETPGLGGEIDNPKWKKSWQGKKVFSKDHQLQIKVLRGTVDSTSVTAQYQIDGLAGATLTSRGISNLVRYWLGQDGYGPLLQRLRLDLSWLNMSSEERS